MNPVESYLNKNNFIPKINSTPAENVGIIIAIPCFNEPNLTDTLLSLWNCRRPHCMVEVIIVINHTEKSTSEVVCQNEKTVQELDRWITLHLDNTIKFHRIYEPAMPVKHAGVGLARKTGMDEAVYRFNLIQNLQGIIVGFDADSQCDPNYLEEIEKHFLNHPKTPGASIYFEHPLDSPSFPAHTNEGIILYELHLRYLNQGLRFTGHPHAFHTVGSSFAVRAGAYVKQGGMNKRQAGEDFYFIQKIIALGNYSEISTTRVIPSPRESDRVPFGTGAAMKKWVATAGEIFTTYNTEAFSVLKSFFLLTEKLYGAEKSEYPDIISLLHPAMVTFLNDNHYTEEIQQIKKNTNSLVSFTNRFYNWFTVFKIIKFLNTSHTNYFEMMDVLVAAQTLMGNTTISDKKEMLLFYRNIERNLL
jgi:hypothetical protein